MSQENKTDVIKEITDAPGESLDLTLIKTIIERLPDIAAKLEEQNNPNKEEN